jgi:predicted signal transduction protein with EAL and GGDEF domain
MALNMVLSAFPEGKRFWALSLIHCNSCTIADIVDMLLQKFSNPFEDEIISCSGTSYKVVGPQDDVSVNARAVNDYTTGHDVEMPIVTLPLNKIKRDKSLTSKIAIKRFIKDVAVKEGGNIGGTWMVKVRSVRVKL